MGRILRELRAHNLVVSEKVKGYNRRRRQQGNYHRISTKGIRYLNQADFDTSRTADQLRMNEYYLPYVLSVNDLVINLEPHGWQVIGGRDTKIKYKMNRGDNIHGMLISPDGTRYGLYIFLNPVTQLNLNKIKKEVSRYSDFPNMLILTKNEASFEQVVWEFQHYNDIVNYVTFNVLPFGFAINYLISLNTQPELMSFMERFEVVHFPQADIETAPSDLQTIVIHEDEEKHFVNMLCNDLTMLQKIRNYRKESYELDGRRVLVVTNMENKYPKMLENIHHIDFVDIKREELADYFRSY